MKKCLPDLKIFTILLVFVLTASMVNAQTRTASVSGPWNNTATWGGASVPTSANDVVINDGINVSIPVAATCASLTINAGTTATTLTVNTGFSLTVTTSGGGTGDVTINAGTDATSARSITLAGTGTFSCASLTMADVLPGNSASNLTIATGSATVGGDIVMNGTGAENLINITGAGTLNIGGNISATNGTLTAAATSTVNYNGASQNVRANTYGNLSISGTNTKTQAGIILVNTNLNVAYGSTLDVTGFNFTVSGNTVVDGTLTHSSASGTKTYTGNVTIDNGGIWNDDAALIAIGFGGNLQNDGTINAGTGTHTFSNNTKTFSGASVISIPNITISGSRTNSGTLTASTLTVNAATTNNGTITASTALAGSSTLTQGSGATLNIGGTSAISGLTASVNSNTVNYTGSGQTVKAITYYHLNFSGSGTETAAGILDINGNITIGNGVTLDGSTFAHTLAGNWINNGGTYTSSGAGSVTFDGTTQSIGGTGTTTFNILALNGAPTTVTLATNIFIAGNLTLSTGDALDLSTFSSNRTAAGGTLSLTASSILKLSGTSGGATGSNFPINFTTNTLSGTVNYNRAAGGQTIYSGVTYVTLTMGNTSGTQTAGGNITCTTLNNNTNAADILDMGTNTLAVTTINNTGTIQTQNTSATPLSSGRTWGGSIEYNGASQTVVAGTYNNLLASGSGTKTTAAAITINGNITIGSGVTFNGSTFSHTIAGNWINNGGTYTSTGTVTFSGTTQSIGGSSSTTFNILAITGTTVTLAINTSVAGNLTLSSSGFLDLSSFSCNRTAVGGTLSVSASSTLKLGGTSGGQSGSNYPLNFTTNSLSGTVNYNSATAGQAIYSGVTYSTLTMGNTSGTQTAGGNIITTTLNNNTNAADILDMGTNTLTVTTVSNTGTIKTQNTSATPLSTGRTWGGTVEYNGASQTVVAATAYNNLVLSGSGTKTMGGAATVSGNVTINTGVTLNEAALTMTLGTASTVTVNGTLDFSNASGLMNTAATGTVTLTMGSAGLIRTVDPLGLGPVATASLTTQGTGTWNTTSIDNNGTVEYYAGVAQALTDRNYNNLTISTTAGTKTWTMAAARTVNGTVTISADAAFTLAGAQTLNVKGDWTKNSTGTFTPGTGTIVFNGGSLQTIGGSASTAFGAITMNNAAGFSLAKDATVNGLMTFSNGIVNASSNILTISATGSVSGASDASFIDGKVKRTGLVAAGGFDFPVGKTGVGYMKIGIANVTDAAAEFTAQYFRASAALTFDTIGLSALGLQAVSNCEYWTLNKDLASSTNADVTLSWNAHSPCGNGSYLSDPLFGIRVAHYNTSTLAWDAHGGGSPSGDASSGSVTWSGVSNFSPFALAALAGSQSGLPVMFNDVKAYEKDHGVQIDWTNLTERDLINYVVERSVNGVNYTAISQQLPTGNNNDKQSYSAFDATPFSGANYYRIKVYEISGKIIYSKVVRVEIGKTIKGITLYPNPVQGNQVSVSINATKGQYTIKVVNTAGQEIYSQRIIHQGGSLTQVVELPSAIKPGVYNMMISGDNYHEAKMFLVQ